MIGGRFICKGELGCVMWLDTGQRVKPVDVKCRSRKRRKERVASDKVCKLHPHQPHYNWQHFSHN